MSKCRVFVSYHHDNDQFYKDELRKINERHEIFEDYSVSVGDINDDLDDQTIRQKIRDDYLRDSSLTLLLVGTETKNRKHIDWELYSSMIDGSVNKKSGILIINLPSVENQYYTAGHGQVEKDNIYPGVSDWTTLDRTGYETRHPYLPERIIDNLVSGKAKISVMNWSKISSSPEHLRFLLNMTYDDRQKCEYDLSRPMKRRNS